MIMDNRQIKILIVDDTPENLEIAGSVLEKKDYDIYVADSGQTALELLETVPFDLILLDIMMPDMDGYDVCRKIREDEKSRGIPIIFLTAKADGESIAKGFELGSVDYIRKPFNAAELVARVKTHVELKCIRQELEEKNTHLEEVCTALEISASTDPLTKLLNRREMIKRLNQELVRFERSRQPFSVVMADVDHFKEVNDHYGHNCGDVVLQKVAAILNSKLRKQDSAARWGGEEFLILLPNTPLAGGFTAAEKLRKAICKERFVLDGAEMGITVTLGVTTCSEDLALDELIRMADGAMYQGKLTGRNRTSVFSR